MRTEPALRARKQKFFASCCRAIVTAKRLGVPIIAGSDSFYVSAGHSVIDEIIALASAGLSNREAIRSATAVAADCLKLSSAKGALQPGMDADLVAYENDPLKDLAALRKPLLVINGGQVFMNKLPDIR